MSTIDPWLDRSNDDVRRLHLEPLAAWLSASIPERRRARVMDFGCGDGLLAELLGECWEVEGYDRSEAARAAARARGSMRRVHDSLSTVPAGAFDVVVLSSVVQYLADSDEVSNVVEAATRWLAPSGTMVITDVVTAQSARVSDVVDLIVGTARRAGVRAAITHLLRTARRSHGPLLILEVSDLERPAERMGLGFEVLVRNLSQFGSRRTVVLRAGQQAG